MQEDKKIQKPVKKKSNIRRIFKWIIYVVIGFFALNLILYALLSIPFVQQKVLDFAVSKVKEIVKTEVKIDEINLSLFNNVKLKGVYIEGQDKDTLAYANNLDVSISPWKLFDNKILITDIDLEDFTINISQKTPESDFNFQFLIDAFAGDTTATDTTQSTLVIDIQNIGLKNGRLKYNVESDSIIPNEFNTSHILISGLNAQLSLPSIDITNFRGNISSLSFKEASGIEVKNLKTEVTSNTTTFYLKDTELALPNSKLKIPLAQYNIITDAFNLSSDKSLLSPSDLSPFYRDLKHLREDIFLKTSVSGKLPMLKIDSLIVNYGENNYLRAGASISDYSNYADADIDLNISNLHLTTDAIADFAKLGDSLFVVPDILKTLGDIRLRASLAGQLKDFNIDAEAWAKQGALQLVAKGATDTTFTNFSVKAKLQTQQFNLGSLLDMPELGRLSGDIDVVASQNSKQQLKAEAIGKVQEIQYNKGSYRNIPFKAHYNASDMGIWLKADLPEGKLEGKVNMTQSTNPKIDIDLNVQSLKIDKFYPTEGWKNPELSVQIKGDVKGIDLKNIEANVLIENLDFSHDTLSYKPGTIKLEAGKTDVGTNYISINSSLANANISGGYNFMTLADELSNMMNGYLPGLFVKKSGKNNIGKNKFDINISIKNTEELGKVFDIPIDIIDPLTIDGTINTIDNKLNMVVNIPNLQYGDLDITATKLNIENTDSIITCHGRSNLNLNSKDIVFDLKTKILSDTIDAALSIKRDSGNYSLDIMFETLAHFEFNKKKELISSLQFLPSKVDIGKLKLFFMPAHIVNEGAETSISNLGFMVEEKGEQKKYFGINGVVSDQKTDTLNISFYHSKLNYLFEAFDIDHIGAVANGDIKLVSILDKPELYTNNMGLSDIVVFNDTLGNLDVASRWSESAGAIRFKASLGRQSDINKSVVAGLVYPDQDSLNLKINLNRFPLGWAQPFIADMLNKISGDISTELTATGKITSPDINGWLGINNVQLGVDYTNVTYSISDTIKITPDKIGFDDLIIKDPNDNKARVNAEVTHTNFADMKYKLNADLRNFMVLNTESRTDSLFYGKIFANGSIQIKGSDDLIQMDMKLQNSKNSTLNIQIPQTSEASVYPSIVYINTPVDETKVLEIPISETSTLPLKLNLNLTITPDLALGVVIDPITGDHMQVKGNGLVNFTYDMKSEDMRAIGNYTLTSGYVKLRLQNLAPIAFQISDGSKLVFNGNPMRTTFDITAYKRVQADLTTLDSSFANDQSSSPRVTVDCVLGIKGNMDKMDLSYNISLPDASDDIQQRVRSLTATDEQKVKQFAYLLVTGSFSGSGGDGNMAQGLLTNVATSAMGTVLNKALGKVIGDEWNIGTNISSDDGSFNSMDMTVSMSRKFMDNKLEFNSNLGYRTAQTNNDQFIGDFDVSYALTRSIKLKVFNRTNDTFYKQAPTTQGIGIVYTKEAKTIKGLLRVIRKKRKKNRTERQNVTNK